MLPLRDVKMRMVAVAVAAGKETETATGSWAPHTREPGVHMAGTSHTGLGVAWEAAVGDGKRPLDVDDGTFPEGFVASFVSVQCGENASAVAAGATTATTTSVQTRMAQHPASGRPRRRAPGEPGRPGDGRGGAWERRAHNHDPVVRRRILVPRRLSCPHRDPQRPPWLSSSSWTLTRGRKGCHYCHHHHHHYCHRRRHYLRPQPHLARAPHVPCASWPPCLAHAVGSRRSTRR
jgi:hypothetical protein